MPAHTSAYLNHASESVLNKRIYARCQIHYVKYSICIKLVVSRKEPVQCQVCAARTVSDLSVPPEPCQTCWYVPAAQLASARFNRTGQRADLRQQAYYAKHKVALTILLHDTHNLNSFRRISLCTATELKYLFVVGFVVVYL
jgi:hypothetical protein